MKLPSRYEKKYGSAYLKTKIADDGMWSLIPGVNSNIDSVAGTRRMKENEPLFTFIDKYFPDRPYDFEPNMQDGRFVLIPKDVNHQGIGICASKDFPGFLEVGHFWYPCEFTEKGTAFPIDQVYIAMFSSNLYNELAEMVRKVFEGKGTDEGYCTFPFAMDCIVTLEGNFLDTMIKSVRKIRDALKDKDPQVQRNGEGLIEFMKRVVK